MKTFSEEKENIYFVNVSYGLNVGNLPPDLFTSELGIQPTYTFSKGDKYLGKVLDSETKKVKKIWREREYGLWRIETKDLMFIKSSRIVDAHMLFLVDLLESKQSIISGYLEKYIIAVYVEQKSTQYDSVHFSGSTLARMGKLCTFIEVFSEMEVQKS